MLLTVSLEITSLFSALTNTFNIHRNRHVNRRLAPSRGASAADISLLPTPGSDQWRARVTWRTSGTSNEHAPSANEGGSALDFTVVAWPDGKVCAAMKSSSWVSLECVAAYSQSSWGTGGWKTWFPSLTNCRTRSAPSVRAAIWSCRRSLWWAARARGRARCWRTLWAGENPVCVSRICCVIWRVVVTGAAS